MLLFAGNGFATPVLQENRVTGRVTSAEDGAGLPGVSIVVKGTQQGTITDVDGRYSIGVSGNDAVLVFSFIGYSSQEIAVAGRTSVDVSLEVSAETLGEVVVTALGIERDERSLGYSVGEVKGESLTRIAQENVLTGLAGQVAGVTINSTGTAGSSVSVIIRGATSLANDNQPLFVIDGVPIMNSLNNITQIGSDNKADFGNAISDLNPEDIASISVLKGPSAAALYGSRAGNGVILITTKSGSKNKKMSVSITSNTVVERPYEFLKMHKKFATGVFPFTPNEVPVLVIEEGSAGGVGPELDKGYNAIQWNSPLDENGDPIPTPLVSHPNNVRNFVQNGITTTNGISIANSTDRLNYRLSYSNMNNRGIIPNSDLFKNSLSINTSAKASDKLTIGTNINLSRNNSNNRPAGNRGANPMQWAYAVSPHIDIMDLRDYWVPGKEGLEQLSQGPGDYNNPWFLAYEVNNAFVRDRLYGNIKADWQITPEFSLMARYGLDTYNEKREVKVGQSYTEDPNGAYGVIDIKNYERNADFLATYTKDLASFNFSVSAGGNARFASSDIVTNATKNGSGLVIPGLYTLGNIAAANLNYSNYSGEKAVHSLYGLVNVGYRDMIYLDLTARNDWSSTLPKANRSYFYPSASLSVLVNEMVDISNSLDMLKLRGGVALAGNDTEPYQLVNVLSNYESWGGLLRLGKSGSLLTPNLKPEQATSYETGIDLAMFQNRLRFSGTYYAIENKNQIFASQLAPSSGYSSQKINNGLLKSTGIELSLGGTPYQKGDVRWDLSVNYSRNRTTVESLPEGVDFITLWSDAKGGARTYVGEEIGDIYDAKLVTVEDKSSPYYGYPILDENGSWQAINWNNTRQKIGNFNPDFLLGMQTSVSYKAFTLNLSFDWRSGGDFVSQTYRYGESDLKTQRWLDLLINPGNLSGDALRDYLVNNDMVRVKDHFNIVGGPTAEYGGFPFVYEGISFSSGGVFNPGVIAEYDNDGNIIGYVENLGGTETKLLPYADNYPWDFTKTAMFDASFVKLREASLSYALPASFIERLKLQNATVSVYTRNLMLWTAAKIGVDPELAYQQEASGQGNGIMFKQGIERYNVTPWVMPIGFKLNLTL
ncbi:MAG: SusC/RagA family TonB-linked outer membrane protein [Bacteroidota bacterium]|nr:SusC/RagA family TonB-linked outer membrane protein [Bacteroidota bacterium]